MMVAMMAKIAGRYQAKLPLTSENSSDWIGESDSNRIIAIATAGGKEACDSKERERDDAICMLLTYRHRRNMMLMQRAKQRSSSAVGNAAKATKNPIKNNGSRIGSVDAFHPGVGWVAST